jgi:hypothetical protein
MPKNIAHILQAMLKSHGSHLRQPLRAAQLPMLNSALHHPGTLKVFIFKLLGGVEEIKQIRVFNSLKHEICLSNVYENIWIISHREHVAYPLFRLMSFREITGVCSKNYTKCKKKKKKCNVDQI